MSAIYDTHLSWNSFAGVAVIIVLILFVWFIAVVVSDIRTTKYDNEVVWSCTMEQRESSCQPVIDPYCTKHQMYGVDNEHCRHGTRVKRISKIYTD